ncbi:hypothetical protein CK203_096113 [Vitis vinifera]|uniref:Uncharacterized protein n=1 Tax=Vitis vinifera TaxID=29760 RepID=A0A438CN48_VITVI|nr:hypothetical protein CK203_096113 [Vitis vinifera]
MVKTAMTGATHREESDASSGTSQLQVPATNPGSIENPTLQITIHANKAPKPEDHVPNLDSENSMVMAWLINSMETALGRPTSFFLPPRTSGMKSKRLIQI